MNNIYIYGLYDPRNNVIRYVGKTNDVNERLKEHIRHAKRKNESPRDRWIKELINLDLEPYILVLEICDDYNWKQSERKWIASCRKKGYDLTNLSDGGDSGPMDYTFTAEHRQKISDASKGNQRGLGYKHTNKHKLKMSKRMEGKNNPNYGKDFSPEHRANLSKAAKKRKHSPETIEKMRLAAIERNQNPEYIAKLSKAAKNASSEIKKKKADAAREAHRKRRLKEKNEKENT